MQDLIPLATPLVIYVEPSGYCNFKCTFCPHYLDPDGLTKDFMELKTFEKIIEDISHFPEPLKVLRLIGTGEPLLNKNILDFAHLASQSSSIDAVELTTNASLLTCAISSQITAHLSRIIVSIEGLSDDAYLKYSGSKYKFDSIVHNVEMLYAHRGNCLVYVKIHSDAISSSLDREFFYKTFLPISDNAFIENLVDLWPEQRIEGLSNTESRFGGDMPHKKVCAQIFKSMMVNANGEVVPCCVDYQRKLKLGSVLETSLATIWNSRQLYALRRKHLMGAKETFAPCAECSYNDGSDVDDIDAYSDAILARMSLNT